MGRKGLQKSRSYKRKLRPLYLQPADLNLWQSNKAAKSLRRTSRSSNYIHGASEEPLI